MLETTLLDDSLLEELEGLFWLRYPNESCGLILPTPHRGRTLIELPNRSLTPRDSFLMKSSDIRLELDEWFTENPDDLGSVIFWHSHPSGDKRPSKADRENRVSGAMNLIVSCPDIEADLITHWF